MTGLTRTMKSTKTSMRSDAAAALPTLAELEADGVWVVGGAVRDALAGDQSERFDIDIAVADGEDWARRAGNALNAPTVKISAHFDIWRIPLDGGQIDVWDLPGNDIVRDLRRRDFTVNAMAVPFGDFRSGELHASLLDPCGGRFDIQHRSLRLVSDGALRADPLRMLRAVRLEAQAGWRPDLELRSAIKRDAALILESAAERQWEELQRILLSERLPWALRRMEQTGLFDRILPELAIGRFVDQRPVHRRDVFWHQIDAVRWIVRLTSPSVARGLRASAIWRELQPLLEVQGVRASLDDWRLPLRLATLLHDIGKPQTRTVEEDGSTHFFGHSELGAEMARDRLTALRVPARTINRVELLIAQHLRPGQVNSPGQAPTDRALHRFHTALGDAAVPLCWLFLADSLATAGAESLLPRWRAYAAHVARILAWQPKRRAQTGRMLDGNAIMEATGLEPGPLVGQIRAKIDEAAAVGEIASVDQAREMARRLARDATVSLSHLTAGH
ncbi:MAG: HD domain-containing protein [Chloroflexi bacterium]|nr:HD domain-containing protein [Chloroflexota bacterium]MYJ91650.1 HD domain-containing protein [Chloroflexota bacterium]